MDHNLFLEVMIQLKIHPCFYSSYLLNLKDVHYETSNYTIYVQDMLHFEQFHLYDVEIYYQLHHHEYPNTLLNI